MGDTTQGSIVQLLKSVYTKGGPRFPKRNTINRAPDFRCPKTTSSKLGTAQTWPISRKKCCHIIKKQWNNHSTCMTSKQAPKNMNDMDRNLCLQLTIDLCYRRKFPASKLEEIKRLISQFHLPWHSQAIRTHKSSRL